MPFSPSTKTPFLEQKYINSGLLDGSRGKYFACVSPGLLEENIAGTPYAAPGIFRPADPPYTIQERVQPYFKLHGSSHWRALNGLTLLIKAENKGSQIDGVALLDWYRNKLKQRLSEPGAKLMIVGYSFRDPHINEILAASVKTGLKLFIIDPAGIGVLDHAPTC